VITPWLFLTATLTVSMPAAIPDPSDSAAAQTTCPADIPVVRALLTNFLSDDRVRSSEGLTAANPANLRVLTDATDNTVCAFFRSENQLRSSTAPSARYVYYAVDGYYFVAILPASATGELLPQHASLMLYDSARTRKGFFSF
jgi:hypothetical protein